MFCFIKLSANIIEKLLDELYYIARENNPQGCWVKARLQQIIPAMTTYKGTLYETSHYRLIELKQQKERIVEGKYIGIYGWVVFN